MKYLSILIKPASDLCNMQCSYCFYKDVIGFKQNHLSKIMAYETVDAIIEKTLNQFSEDVVITYAFQGGEPTCATLAYFEYFTYKVNSIKKPYHHIQYHLQTNGLEIDEKWCVFFKKHEFLIGVSMDGFKDNHDLVRKDSNLNCTYQRVISTKSLFEKYQIHYNVVVVLTNHLSTYAKKIFDWIIEENIEYVQFIPCLNDFNKKENEYALTPENYFNFYDNFIPYWASAYQKNKTIQVMHLNSLICLFAKIVPAQCGYLGKCHMQFIIESDGSVYPCDFYATDQYSLGNIKTDSLLEIAKSKVLKVFILEDRKKSVLCEHCRFKGICNGQCKRMSDCFFTDTYCGYQKILEKYEPLFITLTKDVKRREVNE